jgi:amino acid permease
MPSLREHVTAAQGLLPGLALLFATAVAADFSVYTLISCSRRSGAQSFEGVAELAFGRRGKLLAGKDIAKSIQCSTCAAAHSTRCSSRTYEFLCIFSWHYCSCTFTASLIILVTYLPLIAYIILLRDLTAPVIEQYLVDGQLGHVSRNAIAAGLVALVSPACLLQNLNGLKVLSLISILSLTLLAIAMIIRAAGCESAHLSWQKINLWPQDGVIGLLQALPIFVCAFVCHFNVLPVHGELQRPTRKRLHKTVHWTMGLVATFYCCVGLAGYLYGICSGILGDNILNAFEPSDVLINFGRGEHYTVII